MLSRLYDVDYALTTMERINLYWRLSLEPMIFNDASVSMEDLRTELVNNNDVVAIDYMDWLVNVELPIFEAISSNYADWLFGVDAIPEPPKVVYEDEQNVHEFVRETVRIAKTLMEKYPAEYRRPWDHPFFDTIENDSVHSGDVDLTSLFASVYELVNESERKNEMMARLKEEMDESVGECVTGHMCRLVNAIRGFGYEFETKLSDYEDEKAKTFHRLNAATNPYELDGLADRVLSAVNSGLVTVNAEHGVKILTHYLGVPIARDGADYVRER